MNRSRVLPAVRPNEGLAVRYRRQMRALLKEMHARVMERVKAAYERRVLAQDLEPAEELAAIIARLRHDWTLNFESAAEALARHFAVEASKRSASQFRFILRQAGLAIPNVPLSGNMSSVLAAIVRENVSLIRSIPSRYFSDIEGSVMRSVQRGGDMAYLTKELSRHYDVSWKRAAFIADDQNRKANALLDNAQQLEVGITRAIWQHSHAGKVPRPTHVDNDGQEYDTSTGWYDPDEGRFIFPGELINCRCTSRPVIPGFI